MSYQLELAAAVVGMLDAAVGPERAHCGQIPLEDFGFHHALGGARVEAHQRLAVCLIRRLAPRDAQLFPRVHQNTNT